MPSARAIPPPRNRATKLPGIRRQGRPATGGSALPSGYACQEAADRRGHRDRPAGAIDEFQRELIVEGTREGLAAARARGRTGGRKPKLNARQAATVRRMYQATGPDGKRQHTVAEIAEAVGVHRTTVYDYLNKEG